MNLYVYYDVATTEADALEVGVRAMQAMLGFSAGVKGRLMKRSMPASDRETWMEVYEGVDDAFEAHLDEAARSIDWGRAGPRHLERFVDL